MTPEPDHSCEIIDRIAQRAIELGEMNLMADIRIVQSINSKLRRRCRELEKEMAAMEEEINARDRAISAMDKLIP